MYDMERISYYKEPETHSTEPGNIEVFDFSNDKRAKKEFLFNRRANIMCWNKLFKKSFLQDNKIYFFEGKKFEDHYFGMLALLHFRKIAHLKRKSYYWFRNLESTCLSGKNILDRVDVQTALYQECMRRGFMEKYRDVLEFIVFEKMFSETAFCLKKYRKYTDEIMQEILLETRALGIDIRTNPYYIAQIQKNVLK